MNRLFLLVVIFFFAVSCSAQNKKGDIDNANLYKIIYQNDYNGSAKKSFRIIRNNDDFRACFIAMKEKIIPEVDFKKSNILVLNLGRRVTGGYSVVPEKLLKDGDKLIMVIKENGPKKGDFVTTAITYPVCVVKIDSKKELIVK